MTDLSTLVDDALATLADQKEGIGVIDEPEDLGDDTRGESEAASDSEPDGDLASAATEAEPEVSDADQAALKSAAEANEHFRSYQSELNEELQHVVWLGITDAGRKSRKPRGMRRKRG